MRNIYCATCSARTPHRDMGDRWQCSQHAEKIESVTIAGRSYSVDAEGYCAQLDSYIARTPRGELVTIPADRESER